MPDIEEILADFERCIENRDAAFGYARLAALKAELAADAAIDAADLFVECVRMYQRVVSG